MPYAGIQLSGKPPAVKVEKKWRDYVDKDWLQRVITALPIGLVNTVAVIGQLSWAHDHLKAWGPAGQFLFAGSLESIALFLSYFAYLAEKSNDSALRMKLASYLIGLLVGLLNFSHFSPHWKPTAVGIVVGGMSSLSPWLWAAYSRRVSRTILAANGLIETHALRLGASRWLWHPIRSARVMYRATWTGESRIGKAIAAYETEKKPGKAEVLSIAGNKLTAVE